MDFSNLYGDDVPIKKVRKAVRKIKVPENHYRFNNYAECETFKALFQVDYNELEEKYDSLFNEYAQRSLELEQYNEAIKYFKKAAEINPVCEDYFSPIANAYLMLEEPNKAYEYILKIINYAYDRELLVQGYMLLFDYYEDLKNESLCDVVGYLIDYHNNMREVAYDDNMFKQAEEADIPTTFNPIIVNHFKQLFENTDDLSKKRLIAYYLVGQGCSEYAELNLSSQDYFYESIGLIKEYSKEDLINQFLIINSEELAYNLNKEMEFDKQSNVVLCCVNEYDDEDIDIIQITTGFRDENNLLKFNSVNPGIILRRIVMRDPTFSIPIGEAGDFDFMVAGIFDEDFFDEVLQFYNKKITI